MPSASKRDWNESNMLIEFLSVVFYWYCQLFSCVNMLFHEVRKKDVLTLIKYKNHAILTSICHTCSLVSHFNGCNIMVAFIPSIANCLENGADSACKIKI